MKVLGRDKLIGFYYRHANAKSALDSWFDEAQRARWKTPQDIKRRYPSIDFMANNRVIFNIKGNHYRMVVWVHFQSNLLIVEWIGTHAEYDKKRF